MSPPSSAWSRYEPPGRSRIVAGGATLLYGPHVGGVFLAFPAVLTASVTLIAKKEGLPAAIHDVEGAVFGAIGLAVFAIAFELILEQTALGWALVLSLAAWLGVSVSLYLAAELTRRRSAS